MRLAVLLAACLSPILAVAQTDTWLGGNGNWNNGSMWSAGVPTSTSNAFIDKGNAKASAVTVNDVEQSRRPHHRQRRQPDAGEWIPAHGAWSNDQQRRRVPPQRDQRRN